MTEKLKNQTHYQIILTQNNIIYKNIVIHQKRINNIYIYIERERERERERENKMRKRSIKIKNIAISQTTNYLSHDI